jgi:hypothetical protein
MNGGWGYVGGGRTVVLALALIGLLYLFVSARSGDGAARLSPWSPRGVGPAATEICPRATLWGRRTA